MADYTPVACAIHDRLEHLAINRTYCRIRFLEAGNLQTIEGRIGDILTSQGAEYVVLEKSGRRIRLDLIDDIQPIV